MAQYLQNEPNTPKQLHRFRFQAITCNLDSPNQSKPRPPKPRSPQTVMVPNYIPNAMKAATSCGTRNSCPGFTQPECQDKTMTHGLKKRYEAPKRFNGHGLHQRLLSTNALQDHTLKNHSQLQNAKILRTRKSTEDDQHLNPRDTRVYTPYRTRRPNPMAPNGPN